MKDPRPVTQCDLEGNPIERFPSISVACKALRVVDATIRKAVRDNKVVLEKYRFRFDIVTDPAERERLMKERETVTLLPGAKNPLLPDEAQSMFDADRINDRLDELSQADQDRRELFADLSQNPDRWETPFERILHRR